MNIVYTYGSTRAHEQMQDLIEAYAAKGYQTVAVMGNNQQITFSNGDTWKEINLKANHNPTDKWEKAYIDFNIPLEIEEEVIMPAREGNLEGWPKEF